MSSIDERVVAMAFENQVFEQRAAQTMTTLSKLDSAIKNIGNANGLSNIEAQANKVTLQTPMSALDKLRSRLGSAGQGAAEGLGGIERAADKVGLTGPLTALDKLRSAFSRGVTPEAVNSFSDIEKAADKVSLSGVNRAIDGVANHFSILQGAASVAFGNIATIASIKGAAFLKSFSLGPVIDGFKEYQTNLQSIQTILANTQGQKVSGLDNVNKALAQLNHYSDKTIYNFSEMAKNIGTFTAAGVDLNTSTASIKGIANLAALSGSNSQQASTAMYQLSQAIAAGRVGLQDWNSVVNAGMGGAVFQKALMRTAENMGTVAKGAVKVDKATGKATINGENFRTSIMAAPGKESWLTSDVLTKTLTQFTGDLSDAQLKAQGFNDEQIRMIQQTAKSAQNAATQVKTLPQVFDVARETIGSGWAKTFQLIFGDFKQSKSTFTELSNTINGFINKTSNARNALLKTFDGLDGREKLIHAIGTAFSALFAAIKPVTQAFREIFPATTAQGLLSFIAGFQHLADAVKAFFQQRGGQLKDTFVGVFAVLHIGITIVKEAFRAIGSLLGLVAHGSGGFLGITAAIGRFLVSIDDAIAKGGVFRGLFTGLVSGLSGVVSLFKAVGQTIGSIFSGADKATNLSGALNSVANAGGPLGQIADKLSTAWGHLAKIFARVKEILQPAFDVIKEQASRIGDVLASAFSTGNFDKTLAVLQTAFLGGILLILKRFRSTLEITLGDGVFGKINTMLSTLTGNLKAMQQNLQAKTLFAIAASLGVLVAGVYVLSTIDGKKLTTAMTAMAVGMGELVGVMGLLGKMMSGPGRLGFLMMPVIAASMIELAVASAILAAAMKIFATMSWEELVKGLVGVAGGLAAIGVGMKLLGPSTLVQGPALILIGIALNILAGAVKQFGDIPWKQMVQGLLGMGFAFVALAAGMNLLGPSLILTGPGLVAVAVGMNILAGAVATFGAMKWEDLAKGIVGVAGALVALGIGIAFIPPTTLLTGAGLIVVAAGLTALSAAIGILGSMKVGTLVKGIVGMGGALVVLGLGLSFMSGTLLGSAALLTAAAAFLILGPALAFIGTLHWSTILSGLGAIALTLGVLAIAGTIVAGPLTALSLALGALGIALGLITSPIYILAKALEILGASGTKGIAVLGAALTAFVALLPNIIINFLKGLVTIIGSIAELAPKVAVAIGSIIDTLLAIVISAAPKLAIAAVALIAAFLKVLNESAGPLINAGFNLLVAFLGSINSHLGKVIDTAASIIVTFLKKLANDAPKIVSAGVTTLLKYLGGILSQIPRVVTTVAKIIGTFLLNVANHIPDIVAAGIRLIVKFLNGISSKTGSIIAAGVGLIVAVIKGIGNGLPKILAAGVELIGKFLKGIGKSALKLIDIGYHTVINFMNGLAKAIRENNQAMIDAGFNLADAIIDGMVNGFKQLGGKAVDAVKGFIKGIPNAAKKLLGIHSPSTVFHDIGANVMKGFANGIIAQAPQVAAAMSGSLKLLVDQTKSANKIGKFLGGAFADGLDGVINSGPSGRAGVVSDAFKGLGDQLHQAQAKLKDDIHNDRAKLKDELAKDEPNVAVVQAVSTTIRNNVALLEQSKKATNRLMSGMSTNKKLLMDLGKEYEKVGTQLDAAKQKLSELQNERDNAVKSLTDQFDTLPDVGSLLDDALSEAGLTAEERADKVRQAQEASDKQSQINQVANYKKALQDRIAATQKYMQTLDQLRSLGLDDQTFQKLLSDGTKDQSFADQLLKGGKASVDEINNLDSQLLGASTQLAQSAAKELYQAGVDAAQGLVDGLAAKQKDIEVRMDGIADALVKSIKRRLGIRSPSRVLMEVGKFTAQGMAEGLRGASRSVEDAAAGVGDSAASAMARSLSHISSALSSEIDPDLTITPVLDLTQVQKDAQRLSDLTNVTPITAAASYGQASAALSEVASSQPSAADAAADVPPVQFNQYNTSPEALSAIDIYRNTKNGLSQIGKVVGATP